MNLRFDTTALLIALMLPFSCAQSAAPESTTTHEHPTAAAAEIWYCPMHPSYRSDKPGSCPICNMSLVPLKDGSPSHAPASGGRVPITLTPERQQLIGVKTTPVVRTGVTRTIRAAGRIEVDERGLSAVSLKFAGWIEELYLQSVGQPVKKGDPILSIWSPELYEAEKSYLIARSMHTDERSVGIARQKLLLWDLTEEQIGELEQKKDPDKRTTLLSKVEGVVTRRDAVLGSSVEPGKTLFEIADLRTLWVQAEVYESEIGLVAVGQEATIDVAAMPGVPVKGRVQFIYPTLDETTRTTQVRIEVDNAAGKLAPGMYATVAIAVDLGEQVVIDDDAVIDSGTRQLVFVASAGGRFEPREVVLGHRGDSRAVVLKGLEPGESVVSSANFLVDSESRLRAALLEHSSPSHAGH
jgi:multidrug efflux pump subunit AcrA (membrane-fusion protein)